MSLDKPAEVSIAESALPRRMLLIPPPGAFCDHATMDECCAECGHFSCPCGIAWDEGSEGGFFETYEGEFQ